MTTDTSFFSQHLAEAETALVNRQHQRTALDREIATLEKVIQLYREAIYRADDVPPLGQGRYTVCPDPTEPHCTCKDHAETGGKCKHMFAVEFVLRRERNPDGSITETTVMMSTNRKTYPQNWAAYNAAQTNEKSEFQMLLYDLCQNVEEPPRGRGRPSLPISDMLFAVTFKIYSTFSGRRFISDLNEAYERGYIVSARGGQVAELQRGGASGDAIS